MRQVLATTDRSLVESLRFSLEAEGIGVATGDSATGLPNAPLTVAVLDDADYVRAVTILRDLEATPRGGSERPPWSTRTRRLLALVVLFIIAFFGVCALVF